MEPILTFRQVHTNAEHTKGTFNRLFDGSGVRNWIERGTSQRNERSRRGERDDGECRQQVSTTQNDKHDVLL